MSLDPQLWKDCRAGSGAAPKSTPCTYHGALIPKAASNSWVWFVDVRVKCSLRRVSACTSPGSPPTREPKEAVFPRSTGTRNFEGTSQEQHGSHYGLAQSSRFLPLHAFLAINGLSQEGPCAMHARSNCPDRHAQCHSNLLIGKLLNAGQIESTAEIGRHLRYGGRQPHRNLR